MANVLYGLDSTHKIDLKNIIQHTVMGHIGFTPLSVKMGIKKSLLVVDMPGFIQKELTMIKIQQLKTQNKF